MRSEGSEKVSLGPENPFHLNERRRTVMPFKFSDVNVEIAQILPSEVNSELPDIERNVYVFSNGIGMMSANLAIEVALKFQSSFCLSDKKEILSMLDKILMDSDVAFDIITVSCAEEGNTASIMLSAGFKPQSEPQLRGMLASIRVAPTWRSQEQGKDICSFKKVVDGFFG
ncbi:RNA-dependent RNA polymerase [Datura stramonium]|uniref:RNA-dependent RNA polymerase n=1 Tax=Datura stramonium TaxID=4076 RepID=A0ABS8SS41_DATST|nr:RNA-dependent RNA polymerase [Datura stramonium]